MAFGNGFFQYSKGERNGIIVLCLLIVLVLGIKAWLYMQPAPPLPAVNTHQFQQDIIAFEKDTIIELNRAIKSELINLPRIGPSFADRILAYRDSVGGFATLQQLQLIKGIGPATYQGLLPYVRVDSTAITTLHWKQTSIEDLNEHPYISTELAQSIKEIDTNQYVRFRDWFKPQSQYDSLLLNYLHP